MTQLKIFESSKSIDLDRLIDTRALICANSGGGKSYAVRKIIEEAYGKVGIIVIDGEGEFKTLREKYDFLVIGEGGDIPLSPEAADMLPEKLLENNISAIVDISELKHQPRIQYVKKFLDALLELPSKYFKPYLIFIDEIHKYCGQQGFQDSTQAVINLATTGRKRGFCLMGATQRISKYHKDAAAEANNILIGRTGLDVDMKRAGDLLGFVGKNAELVLRDLEDGEFFVYGPAISKHVDKEKIAKVKTTHPKRGELAKAVSTKPSAQILKQLAKLGDIAKEKKEKLKEVQDYKNKIAELNRTIAEMSKPQSNQIDKNELHKLRSEHQAQMQDLVQQYTGHIKALESQIRALQKTFQELRARLSKIEDLSHISVGNPQETQIKPFKAEIKPIIRAASPVTSSNLKLLERPQKVLSLVTEAPDGEVKFGICEKMIYTFLHQNSHRTYNKEQIAISIGYSSLGSGYNNALGKLNSQGIIRRDNGSITLKQQRDDLLLQDQDFSIENTIKKLGKCEQEIISVLREFQEEMTKEEIAEKTTSNYSPLGSGYNNALGRLNTLGFIQRIAGRISLHPQVLEI